MSNDETAVCVRCNARVALERGPNWTRTRCPECACEVRSFGCTADAVAEWEREDRRAPEQKAGTDESELRKRVWAAMDAWRALIAHRTPVAVGAKQADDEHRRLDWLLESKFAESMTRLGNVPSEPIDIAALSQPKAEEKP